MKKEEGEGERSTDAKVEKRKYLNYIPLHIAIVTGSTVQQRVSGKHLPLCDTLQEHVAEDLFLLQKQTNNQ